MPSAHAGVACYCPTLVGYCFRWSSTIGATTAGRHRRPARQKVTRGGRTDEGRCWSEAKVTRPGWFLQRGCIGCEDGGLAGLRIFCQWAQIAPFHRSTGCASGACAIADNQRVETPPTTTLGLNPSSMIRAVLRCFPGRPDCTRFPRGTRTPCTRENVDITEFVYPISSAGRGGLLH